MLADTLKDVGEIVIRVDVVQPTGRNQALDDTEVPAPPSSAQLNIQFLRLCRVQHKRKNCLFAGALRAGKRAAAIMSLIQSARLNGRKPF